MSHPRVRTRQSSRVYTDPKSHPLLLNFTPPSDAHSHYPSSARDQEEVVEVQLCFPKAKGKEHDGIVMRFNENNMVHEWE